MSFGDRGAFNASAISWALELTLPRPVLMVLKASLRLGLLSFLDILLCLRSFEGPWFWGPFICMPLSIRCSRRDWSGKSLEKPLCFAGLEYNWLRPRVLIDSSWSGNRSRPWNGDFPIEARDSKERRWSDVVAACVVVAWGISLKKEEKVEILDDASESTCYLCAKFGRGMEGGDSWWDAFNGGFYFVILTVFRRSLVKIDCLKFLGLLHTP